VGVGGGERKKGGLGGGGGGGKRGGGREECFQDARKLQFLIKGREILSIVGSTKLRRTLA